MQIPSEIDATGKNDARADLNAFFASLSNGTATNPTTVDLSPLARYRCEDFVMLAGGKTWVTINFNGAYTFATTKAYRERAHLRVASSRNIRVNHPKVIGANPYSGLDDRAYNKHTEAQHGIEVLSTIGCVIDHPEIRGVFGDFIHIGRRTAKTAWSSWVQILSPFGRDNGRMGMSFNGASVVSITDIDFDRMRRSVFDFEPDSVTDGAYAVTVDGGRSGRAHTGFLVASHGKAAMVEAITVKNLYLPNSYVSADVASLPGARCRRDFALLDNVSAERAERTPMTFVGVDGVTVRGNTQPLLQGVKLAETHDCTAVAIQV